MRARLAVALMLALTVRAAEAQATIVGTVVDSLRAVGPLRGATVVIPELSRYVTTDSLGRFRIEGVPSGRYTMTFLHPLLDSLDIAAEVVPVSVPAAGTLTARLATPSPPALVWLVCRAASDSFPAMIIGHVRDAADGQLVTGARIDVMWSEIILGRESVDRRTIRAAAETRASGAFVLCGVPPDARLEVGVSAGDRVSGPLTITLAGSVFERIELTVGSRSQVGRVSGVVVDGAGRAVRGALVRVAGGTGLPVRSDSGGAFVLDGVAAGTQELDVRGYGFWPATERMSVPSGGAKTTRIILRGGGERKAVPRGDISLVAGSVPDDPSGFEDRRFAGLGHFITGADLEQKPARTLNDVFKRAPSVHLREVARHRMAALRDRAGEYCTPSFFVNGLPWRAGIRGFAQSEIESVVASRDLRGVEVYTAQVIPRNFDRRDGCGSIVLWTR